MEKKKKTKPNESQYFAELLKRIRDIRSSERSATAKIADVVATAVDYDSKTAARLLGSYIKQLSEQDAIERFANKLIFYAETKAECKQTMTMEGIEIVAHAFIYDNSFKQDIYDYPSFQGNYEEEDGGQVSLPEELQNFRGSSMVLKIEDLDRLIDTFCSRNTYYRRAYAILADLDKQILECVENGVFPDWILIPYKDDGDAMFEFSHFEVDLREPDEEYRTLYVVYRYDTTAS